MEIGVKIHLDEERLPHQLQVQLVDDRWQVVAEKGS